MPTSVTKRSASGMRFLSRSLGRPARSCTAKPHRAGQRAKSVLILVATSASSRLSRVSGRPGLNSRVFMKVAPLTVIPRRQRYTACHKNTNREIPEPTTPKPLGGKNRCRDNGPVSFVRLCYRGETAIQRGTSVKRAGEGAAADQRARFGMLRQKLRQRGGDVLEDLARIVVSERGQDAHVRDEELVFIAAARAMIGNVLQTAHREAGKRGIALEQRFDRRWNRLFHGFSVRGFRCASRLATRARAA